MAAKKTKSQLGNDGGRKLAVGAGRKTHKSGGEPQKKDSGANPGRTGSSRQHKS